MGIGGHHVNGTDIKGVTICAAGRHDGHRPHHVRAAGVPSPPDLSTARASISRRAARRQAANGLRHAAGRRSMRRATSRSKACCRASTRSTPTLARRWRRTRGAQPAWPVPQQAAGAGGGGRGGGRAGRRSGRWDRRERRTGTTTKWILKSVVAGGKDALDFGLVVEPNQDVTATITFGDKTQEVSGTIQDTLGNPTADYTIIVFAVGQGLLGAAGATHSVRPAGHGRQVHVPESAGRRLSPDGRHRRRAGRVVRSRVPRTVGQRVNPGRRSATARRRRRTSRCQGGGG